MAGFCEQHWKELKEEIIKQDLGELCAKNADIGKEMLRQGLFEPLMWAHNSLGGLAFDVLGPVDGCPVCNLIVVNWPAQAALRSKQRYLLLLDEENAIENKIKPN